jgi:predicted metal-dependent hydrolase
MDLRELNDRIQRGQGARVREQIAGLTPRDVARADAATVAQLAWRSGIPELGVRLLNAIVRPSPRRPATPTAAECAEYAVCLIRSGSVDEGLLLLAGIDGAQTPQAIFYRVVGLVAQWDYERSVPLLESYLASPSLSEYQRLVGLVNLAAAYVHLRRLREAQPLLRELLYKSSLHRYQLMVGRVMELAGEYFIESRRWQEAHEFLDEAQARLRESGSIDAFIVRRFQADLVYLESGGERGEKELLAVREEALSRSHWETVRELDRLRALPARDPALWHRVFFGTPFAPYRRRLLEDMRVDAAQLPPSFEHVLGDPARAAGTFDLFTAMDERGKRALKSGSLTHRLLTTLASDFYRPATIPSLFAKLYPDQHYHPLHSPALIHDAIARLREWFERGRLPLTVAVEGHHYRLACSRGYRLRIPRPEALALPYLAKLEQIRRVSGDKPFGVTEAATWLDLPRRSTARLVNQACDDAVLDRVGNGRFTRYAFRRQAG